MISGKLGRLGNLLAQSYQQRFAKLLTLLKLLEKLTLPFPDQIKLEPLKLFNFLENPKFNKLLKLERLIMPFLNQTKKWLKMLKLGLLKFELLQKTQRLPVKLFLLMKLELFLLTLSLLNLSSPKKNTAETRRGWRGSAA